MKSISILVLGLLLARISMAQDVADLVSKHGKAIATIAAYDNDGRLQGIGTGFILEDGVIITSEHVVRDANYIGSTFSDAIDGDIRRVEHVDAELDLALLTTSSKIRSKGLTVSDTPPEIGSEIVVIGSPMGLKNNATAGIVSAFKSVGNVELLEISAPVSEGSNGSPVLNRDGEVVGVVTSQFDGDADVNLAVSAKHLLEVIGSRKRIDEGGGQRSSYTIVVSSETTESSANDVALSYGNQGHEAQVLSFRVGDEVRYRVCLGNYDSREAAVSDRDRLAGADLPSDAWVIEMP